MFDDVRRARTWWRGPHWWMASHPRAGQRSGDIPVWMQYTVMAMDRGRCLYCGSRLDLHIDHITPWRFGGRSRLANLAVLCAHHNLIKGAYWVAPTGRVYYPHGRPESLPLAAAITEMERYYRWSPARWVRAVTLGAR